MGLFSKRSAAEAEQDKVAKEYLEEGERLAREAMNRQLPHLLIAQMNVDLLGQFMDAHRGEYEEMLEWFELQFMWGFFHEYVQTQEFPTNGYDRIIWHLIYHLSKVRGRTLEQARDEATEMNAKFNADDGMFMAVADLGKQAYHDPELKDALSRTFYAMAQLEAENNAVPDVNKFVISGPEAPEDAELSVSQNPGAHEAHLIRRYRNPYFEEDRQTITQAEILRAREVDEQEYEKAVERFQALIAQVHSLPEVATIGDLQPLRERIEDFTEFCLSVDGKAKALATQADKLRDVLINAMRDAASNDPQNLEAIETADAYHNDVIRPMHLPIVAQIRKDGLIPLEDVIPTLVSQESAIIEIIMNLLPVDETDRIRVEALELLLKKSQEGYCDPEYAEKAAILMKRLGDEDSLES